MIGHIIIAYLMCVYHQGVPHTTNFVMDLLNQFNKSALCGCSMFVTIHPWVCLDHEQNLGAVCHWKTGLASWKHGTNWHPMSLVPMYGLQICTIHLILLTKNFVSHELKGSLQTSASADLWVGITRTIIKLVVLTYMKREVLSLQVVLPLV